jgi:hypothetical protein
MFDLTNKQSFYNLDLWLARLNEMIDITGLFITVIGNKADLSFQRKIPQNQIDDFLQIQKNNNIHIEYYECQSLDIIKSKEIMKNHLFGIYLHRYKLNKGIEYYNQEYNIQQNEQQYKRNVFSCILDLFTKK